MELGTHKKKFEGTVKKIHKQNAIVEFERLIYYPKYERFAKDKTRIHAHIPKELVEKVKVNDQVIVAETRPISKTKSHIIIKILK